MGGERFSWLVSGMFTKKQKIEIPEEWLREQYVTLGRSAKSIGEEFGCSETVVLKRLNEYGINTSKKKNELTKEKLAEMVESGMTMQEMADYFGCNRYTIRGRLIKFGLKQINLDGKPERNLEGQKFGFLTVKSLVGRSKKEDWIWLCECECGNDTYQTTSSHLLSRVPPSCGCRSRQGFNRILTGEGFVPKRLLDRLSREHFLKRGNNRIIDFQITLDELESLPHDKCKYCGTKLTFPRCTKDFRNRAYNASLDRIDSSIDCYCKTNTQWICKTCNLMKLDWTEDEFLEHIRKMSEEYLRRKREEEKDYMDGL